MVERKARKAEECSKYILRYGKKTNDTWKLYKGHSEVLLLKDAATATELASEDRIQSNPSASLHGTGWRMHPSNTQLLGRWDSALPHPTRPDKVLICTQGENAVHPLFLTRQYTWDSSSTNGRPNPAFPVCPLNKQCVQQSLSRHNYWVTCPPPALLKRVFCQKACAHLLIHSEAEPKNREQATTVQIVHIAYFLAQLQSTQRVGCRLDEWFW